MEKDFVIGYTLLAHHSGTYLAQANAMAPPCPYESETCRYAVGDIESVNHESRTL